MQPPVRLHLNPNRPRRFHPDERGTAKEQRIRRVANQESINLFGGENGRRLLTQLVSPSHIFVIIKVLTVLA